MTSSAGPAGRAPRASAYGSQDGEAPAIGFAGAGRIVPWATWYENTVGAGFANNNVFASRFDNTGDANQQVDLRWPEPRPGWHHPGLRALPQHPRQPDRGETFGRGGAAVDPTKPGPWVTWQETTNLPVNLKNQIFVEKPLGPAQPNCVGVKPAAVDPMAAPIGGFCWQQVGLDRVGTAGADPSLNVDPTRDGIEPDIAFIGANDAVPWVVWYETGGTTLPGLHANELVFAAKASLTRPLTAAFTGSRLAVSSVRRSTPPARTCSAPAPRRPPTRANALSTRTRPPTPRIPGWRRAR